MILDISVNETMKAHVIQPHNAFVGKCLFKFSKTEKKHSRTTSVLIQQSQIIKGQAKPVLDKIAKREHSNP